MGITVNTSPQQITASVGETKIDVTVSGGIGPSGAVGGGYVLPTATASVLGGVKIGSGISIDGNGVISASSGYTLPTATASVLGGVKIGSGVTITDGVISVSTNYAAASDFDQGVKTTDSPEFAGLTMASGQVTFSSSGGTFQLAGFSRYIDFETGNIGHSGLAGWVFAGEMDFSSATIIGIDAADVGAAAVSHAHSAADVTSGQFDIARIPTGSTSTTVCIGNDARLSDARTPTAHNHAASDINSGVLATARLASSGTASATTFLRGDQTWATAGSSSASDLTSGTLAYARMADPTVTSPSQITANQNDYASFARGINRFTTNAARDITGMVAGSDGEVRVLCNTGTTAANTLTIKDESSSSTAANRFSVPWNGDCVIAAESSVVVFYDGTSSRWRVI